MINPPLHFLLSISNSNVEFSTAQVNMAWLQLVKPWPLPSVGWSGHWWWCTSAKITGYKPTKYIKILRWTRSSGSSTEKQLVWSCISALWVSYTHAPLFAELPVWIVKLRGFANNLQKIIRPWFHDAHSLQKKVSLFPSCPSHESTRRTIRETLPPHQRALNLSQGRRTSRKVTSHQMLRVKNYHPKTNLTKRSPHIKSPAGGRSGRQR